MGHLAGKDVFARLGKKIDGMPMRAPWNETFREMLEALYSPEEADLVAKMPYGPSTLERVARITGYEKKRLRVLLDRLCDKGLVMDVHAGGRYRYSVSPLVVGIFEFTMMRTDGGVDRPKMARIFHDYLSSDDTFFRANYGHQERTSFMRALPYEGTVRDESFVEVLDYEKATAIVENADRFCMGVCSCRHEKHHLGNRTCEVPMDNCSSFGNAAGFLIRRGMGKEVSRSEMLESLARSRELGLVLNADNVKSNVTFICHCCGCCCNALEGISKSGYPNVVVTSTFIASRDDGECKGCNFCEKACPVNAIRMVPDENPRTKRKKKPSIDESFCLGCGVCATKCQTGAMRLEKRGQRVLHPENTFQRVLLMSLEHGTLQNQLFDNPQSRTHGFMRGLVGGFLRLPPVKRSLISDLLRSRFLKAMEASAKRKGGEFVTRL
jgi:ferredoxin